MNTTAIQFVKTVTDLSGSGNITIPVKDLPAIQASIISTTVEAAIVFYLIGIITALIFSGVCFLIWKKANHTGEEDSGCSEELPEDKQ
jgi:hypothetical protein